MMKKRRGREVLGKEEITFRTNGRKKANGKGEKNGQGKQTKRIRETNWTRSPLDVIKSPNKKT
jgi:hypothetical protein